MIFASRVQKTVEIPHDPPHTALIQKLPRRHFLTAGKKQQATLISDIRAQFGTNWQQEIDGFKSRKHQPDVENAAKDPLLQFDVDTLLTYGVKAWTYDQEPNEEALADLDQETAEYLAREVLRLSAPKLFEAEDGEELKNDSASSGTA
jgi:hypothetical protein